MGIPILGPSFIYSDKMLVIHNSSRPESVLRNKSNSISYHAVHESVAMNEFLVEHIPSKENIADLLTKILYGKKEGILSEISYMIIMMIISHQYQ